MLSSIRERADVFFRSVKIRDDAASHKGGLYALYRKELADHLRSRRFLIILALILLTSCASIYGALSGLSEAVGSGSQQYFSEAFYVKRGVHSVVSFLHRAARALCGTDPWL